MSFVSSFGAGYKTVPAQRFINANAGAATTLNATGETCQLVGAVHLQDPFSSSKTISAAGGGKIIWVTSSVTFANAGTSVTVSIQDLSAASSPGQGDGTDDVAVTYTGGGGGITSSAVIQSAVSTGTKTIAHGDLIAIVISMTARGGTDSVTVQHGSIGTEANPNILGGSVIENTTGSYVNQAVFPQAYILFDDGTIGHLYLSTMVPTAAALTYNSGTGTADEYANLMAMPNTFLAMGIKALTSFAGNSSDLELLLYSDPLGTPVAERTITVDATQVSATASVRHVALPFTTPFYMKANTPYAVAVRPTTTNNITNYYFDGDGLNSNKYHAPNDYVYAVRRLDNTGAFSDYNGGTAKTRMMAMYVYGKYVEQGVNMCSGQVGVY